MIHATKNHNVEIERESNFKKFVLLKKYLKNNYKLMCIAGKEGISERNLEGKIGFF